ncbi:MAG: hypothetical protein LBU66_00350 [Treponema sp.]|jgi:hypothetical protein|nr:hypothetical protein [Treponema sp.]
MNKLIEQEIILRGYQPDSMTELRNGSLSKLLAQNDKSQTSHTVKVKIIPPRGGTGEVTKK